MAQLNAAPQQRAAQRALADAVTALVHGEAALESARRISEALFSGQIEALTLADFEQLRLDGIDCTVVGERPAGLLAAARRRRGLRRRAVRRANLLRVAV